MDPMFESQVGQLARALCDVQAAPEVSAPGYLYGAIINLFQAAMTIGNSTTYANFVANVATYDTYAAVAITWAAPSIAADGTVEVLSQAITFRPVNATVPNSIFGVWISDSTSTYWYFAVQFSGGPKPMQNADQLIRMTLRFRPASQTLLMSFD